jgi:hypothetical protein
MAFTKYRHFFHPKFRIRSKDTVFEGGISINMEPGEIPPENLARFKQFYGFKIPKKWAHLLSA